VQKDELKDQTDEQKPQRDNEDQGKAIPCPKGGNGETSRARASVWKTASREAGDYHWTWK